MSDQSAYIDLML